MNNLLVFLFYDGTGNERENESSGSRSREMAHHDHLLRRSLSHDPDSER